jgi:hypothetical protein
MLFPNFRPTMSADCYTQEETTLLTLHIQILQLRGGSEPSLHGSHLLLHHPFQGVGFFRADNRVTQNGDHIHSPSVYWTMRNQKRHKSQVAKPTTKNTSLCLLGGWPSELCINVRFLLHRNNTAPCHYNSLIALHSENHTKLIHTYGPH